MQVSLYAYHHHHINIIFVRNTTCTITPCFWKNFGSTPATLFDSIKSHTQGSSIQTLIHAQTLVRRLVHSA